MKPLQTNDSVSSTVAQTSELCSGSKPKHVQLHGASVQGLGLRGLARRDVQGNATLDSIL